MGGARGQEKRQSIDGSRSGAARGVAMMFCKRGAKNNNNAKKTSAGMESTHQAQCGSLCPDKSGDAAISSATFAVTASASRESLTQICCMPELVHNSTTRPRCAFEKCAGKSADQSRSDKSKVRRVRLKIKRLSDGMKVKSLVSQIEKPF